MSRIAPLSLLLLLLAAPADAGDAPLSADQRLVREIYADLIGIDSTEAHGSTTAAATALASRLKDAGCSDDEIRILGPKLVAGLHKVDDPATGGREER